jgi:hypothetical protein
MPRFALYDKRKMKERKKCFETQRHLWDGDFFSVPLAMFST